MLIDTTTSAHGIQGIRPFISLTILIASFVMNKSTILLEWMGREKSDLSYQQKSCIEIKFTFDNQVLGIEKNKATDHNEELKMILFTISRLNIIN